MTASALVIGPPSPTDASKKMLREGGAGRKRFLVRLVADKYPANGEPRGIARVFARARRRRGLRADGLADELSSGAGAKLGHALLVLLRPALGVRTEAEHVAVRELAGCEPPAIV